VSVSLILQDDQFFRSCGIKKYLSTHILLWHRKQEILFIGLVWTWSMCWALTSTVRKFVIPPRGVSAHPVVAGERECVCVCVLYLYTATSAKTRWVSYIVVHYWLHPSCRVELLGSFWIRCGWWRWSSWVFCGLADLLLREWLIDPYQYLLFGHILIGSSGIWVIL